MYAAYCWFVEVNRQRRIVFQIRHFSNFLKKFSNMKKSELIYKIAKYLAPFRQIFDTKNFSKSANLWYSQVLHFIKQNAGLLLFHSNKLNHANDLINFSATWCHARKSNRQNQDKSFWKFFHSVKQLCKNKNSKNDDNVAFAVFSIFRLPEIYKPYCLRIERFCSW